jgi:hypothetical protein
MTKSNYDEMNDDAGRAKQVSPAWTGIILSSMLWGFVIGLAGFIGGFFGPIIFAPGANQGPLLGIFITGPVGVFIGILYGAVRAFRNR